LAGKSDLILFKIPRKKIPDQIVTPENPEKKTVTTKIEFPESQLITTVKNKQAKKLSIPKELHQ
jgi:hypothetical protein